MGTLVTTGKKSTPVKGTQSYDTKDRTTQLNQALFEATYCGRTEIVSMLLGRTNSVNPNVQDELGDTPLIIACREGWADIVEMLLSRNVEVSIQNKRGDTALIVAASKGCKTIFPLMLEAVDDA